MFLQSNHSTDLSSTSDQELWVEFKNGSREALSELFLRFYEQLYRYGHHFSSGEDFVRDGIQKLFFRLWKKRKKIDTPCSIDGYLYVSLRRILLRRGDQETSRDKRNANFMDQEIEKKLSIEERIIIEERREQRRKLYLKALKSLSPRQKEALLLRVDSGMSNSEIAEIMDVSDKRVRNYIYEATKKMRNEICKLDE